MTNDIVENILKERYYQPGESSWSDIAKRVAEYVSNDIDEFNDFYEVINEKKFIPNSPCLMNAGTDNPMLFACFVLDVPDDMKGIGNTLTDAMCIQAKGGGTGFYFGNLRPKGALVKSTNGIASGPVSFLKAYDAMTNVILQGGCVDVNTRIQTDKGYIKIGELVDCPPFGDNPIQIDVMCKNGYSSAILSSDNGISNVINILSKHGYSIKCTYNHQLMTVLSDGTFGYKQACDITENDYIVIKRGEQTVIEYVELPKPDFENRHFNTNLNLNIPTHMDEDLALLLGIYMANGSTSGLGTFHVCIGDKDTEIIDELLRIGDKYGMWFSTYRKPNNVDRSTNFTCRSNVFYEWFVECGFKKKGSKYAYVPEQIFRSPESVIKAFIRGVFSCDGHVHNYGYPMIGVTSERLIDDLQILLQSIGIFSIKSKREKTGDMDTYGLCTMYNLRVCDEDGLRKFKHEIGFIPQRKQDKLRCDIKAQDLIVPFISNVVSKHYHPNGGRDKTSNPSYAKEVERYIRGDRNPSRNRMVEICNELRELSSDLLKEDLLSNDFIFSKVVNITNDRCYTVDIETIEHNYVANGILIHNKRRGANMGSLSVWHSDIKEFITCKHKEGDISNFNISVLINNEFMNNPDKEILNLIVDGMWKNGEPGLQFFENINSNNPTPELGDVYGSNPCSETFLYPNESCVLGSLDVSKYYDNKINDLNYKKLERDIHTSVRFLDSCIDKNMYPTKEIELATKKTRKIGLGIMGFADLLIMMNIQYGSDECIQYIHTLMSWFDNIAISASEKLAIEKGALDITTTWKNPMRNALVTLIAPTGSISLFANCSSGIEPNFAYVYNRSTWVDGEKKTYRQLHPLFMESIKSFQNKEQIIEWMINNGTIQNCTFIDKQLQSVFLTAKDITWQEHVDVLSSFQAHIHNSISKTINCPNNTTKEEIKDCIFRAWKNGCKGLTIYREGSRNDVVLETNASKKSDDMVKLVEISNPVKYKLVNANGRVLPKTPREMPATLVKKNSGCGKMMIAVGEAYGGPHSVTIVNKGGCDAMTQALAELTALGLRWGIPGTDLVKTLKGIKCSAALRNPISDGKSCPDILGKVIDELYEFDAMPDKKDHVIDVKPKHTKQSKISCPDCGEMLVFSSGCVSCNACGYSKCD